MSRKSAREIAMKLLYEYSITGELSLETLNGSPDILDAELLDDVDMQYIRQIVETFLCKQAEIDGIVSRNSHSWRIERIAKVDLAILRLALFEIKYLDVPAKVSVNEAVELAKKYSADKAYQYVNGLLGGYLRNTE